ncbi:MAG TPA: hypothetical protein VH478_15945 [Trebonia sp.]|nr:hypothetical protein [Trebonia sp.]
MGGPGSRAAYPRPMSRRRSTARAAAPLAVPVALGVTLGVILAVTSGAAPAHVSRGNAGIPSTSAAPAASVAPHAHDPSVVTSVIPGEAGHHGAPGEAGHDTVPGAPGAGPGR